MNKNIKVGVYEVIKFFDRDKFIFPNMKSIEEKLEEVSNTKEVIDYNFVDHRYNSKDLVLLVVRYKERD